MSAGQKPLTPADVRARVAYIDSVRRDDDVAHSEEDRLYRDVLKHIAGGGPGAAILAAEALKAYDLDFSRWYA